MRDFTRLIVWRKAFALTIDLERDFEPLLRLPLTSVKGAAKRLTSS